MISIVDMYMLEKKIGKDAADKLRKAFRSELSKAVNVKGESKKATVAARYKYDRLNRLSFIAPHYIFKQHYGFEGTKKNGVNMHLKATDVLNKALQSSGVLDTLGDELANLRAEEVLTAINFTASGR